jgi:chlorobactene glucosyltransferase
LLQAKGGRVKVAAGEHVARVRMYRGFSSLWEGFSKNAVDIVGGSLATMVAAILGILVAWAVLLVPLGLGWAAWRGADPGAAAGCALATLASCVALGVQAGALRHFRAPLLMLPLLPAGVTLAAVLAMWSVRLRRAGRVRWKGRTYAQQDYAR